MLTSKIQIINENVLQTFPPEKHAHFNSLFNRPLLVNDKMMGTPMTHSKSSRGGRLFPGANRRQAAGFRQGWMARAMPGLMPVF
jgi:hypothetical protein